MTQTLRERGLVSHDVAHVLVAHVDYLYSILRLNKWEWSDIIIKVNKRGVVFY